MDHDESRPVLGSRPPRMAVLAVVGLFLFTVYAMLLIVGRLLSQSWTTVSYPTVVVGAVVIGGVFWVLFMKLVGVMIWSHEIEASSLDAPSAEDVSITLVPSALRRAGQSVVVASVGPLLASYGALLSLSGMHQVKILLGLWLIAVPLLWYVFTWTRRRHRIQANRTTERLRATIREHNAREDE